MKTPTLKDVAKKAGVSYATADRVINNRGNVAINTKARVERAMQNLNYKKNLSAASLARNQRYKLVFLLPQSDFSSTYLLRQSVFEAQQKNKDAQLSITLRDVRAFDSRDLARALADCKDQKVSAVCMIGHNDPMIEPIISDLRQAGIGVFTIMSDLKSQNRSAFISSNNLADGRTAARLMLFGHQKGGAILPISGSLDALSQAQRFAGFMSLMKDKARILPVIQTSDDPENIQTAIKRAHIAITRTRNQSEYFAGIYYMGSAHDAFLQAVDSLSAFEQRPSVILHDLTTNTQQALHQGQIDAIIDHAPSKQVARVIKGMKSIRDSTVLEDDFGTMSATIYLRDNLPPPVTAHRKLISSLIRLKE